MRVLVTGGRGLLGGAIVRELAARGHDVTTLQRSPAGHAREVREVLGDVTDARVVEQAMAGAEAVVHAAALVSMTGDWPQFERINVGGTRVVLAAARAAGVSRLVYVSSPSVAHAGEPLVGADADPADPARARGHYARSKALGELLALGADEPGLRVAAIRPHLVFGPGDTQLVGRIIDRARAGRLVLIGSGSALIDTTFVANAADAIAQAVARCQDGQVHGRAFVVTNGEPRTVAELLARIAMSAGAPGPRRRVPFRLARGAGVVVERFWRGRAGEPPITAFLAEQLATAHWFDQRRTRAALEWTPRIGLTEGLGRLGPPDTPR